MWTHRSDIGCHWAVVGSRTSAGTRRLHHLLIPNILNILLDGLNQWPTSSLAETSMSTHNSDLLSGSSMLVNSGLAETLILGQGCC